MPVSDWPPYPGWLRFPHWNVECRCRRFFPAGLEPPPFWFYPGEPQIDDYWKFLEAPRYLIPFEDDEEDCGWYWENRNITEQSLRRMELRVTESQSFPGVIEFRLTCEVIVIPIEAKYENRDASPVSLLSAPEPRPTEYAWSTYSWVDIQPQSTIYAPYGTLSVVPVACLPDWKWGQPVPLWELD